MLGPGLPGEVEVTNEFLGNTLALNSEQVGSMCRLCFQIAIDDRDRSFSKDNPRLLCFKQKPFGHLEAFILHVFFFGRGGVLNIT